MCKLTTALLGGRLAKASGAEVRVYRHNDLQHLATLLDKTPRGRRKLVVTDSLFSMDGAFFNWGSLLFAYPQDMS